MPVRGVLETSCLLWNLIRRVESIVEDGDVTGFEKLNKYVSDTLLGHGPKAKTFVLFEPGFLFLPALDGSLIHPKAGAPTSIFFIAPCSSPPAQAHRLSETSGLDTPPDGRIEHRLNPAGEFVASLPQNQRDRVIAGRR